MTQTDPTLSRLILEMATIAGEYCSFIENASAHPQEDIIRSMRSLVPLLYLRGTLIPELEPEYPEANERYVTEEQWDGIFTMLRALFSDKDEFYYAGLSEYEEPILLKGSLSEHLTDVYQDMKDFVLLFKKASLASRENAVHECRRMFYENWGSKLANVLPVLHTLYQPEIVNKNNEEETIW
jgi:hypothetical protein